MPGGGGRAADGKDRGIWKNWEAGTRPRRRRFSGFADQMNGDRWRSCSGAACAGVVGIGLELTDNGVEIRHRLEALDALANMAASGAASAVESVITADGTPAPIVARAFDHLGRQLSSQWTASRDSAQLPAVVRKALATPGLQASALQLISALGDLRFTAELMTLAKSPSTTTRCGPRRLMRPPSRRTRRCWPTSKCS